jgi:hypothetical protein
VQNLRQIAQAIQQSGGQPAKQDPARPSFVPDPFFYKLLPYVEQDGLYRTYSWLGTGGGNRLGVPLERVSPALANQLKLPKDQGRVVGEVKKGSTGEKAGLKQHDILLEINGKPIPASDTEFDKLLPEGKDAKVAVTVLREGKRLELKDIPLVAKKDIPLPVKDGTSQTVIFTAPADSGRAWEWNNVWGHAHSAGLPRGYEVVSREPVLTTEFRDENRFTVRLQEGTLAITVVGTTEGKKSSVDVIKVQEGSSTERFTSMDKVPAEYRDKAARLLKIGEKSDR